MATETFEERLTREKAERKQKEEDNLVLAQTVAILLGGIVLPCPEDREYGYKNCFTATMPDGSGVNLCFDQYGNKGRIVVSGDYPHDTRNRADSITISQDKTPERIALDIQRRFMPEYNKMYKAAVERKAEAEAYEAAKQACMDTLCTFPGVSRAQHRGDRLYIRCGGISGELSSISADTTCTVELRNVPFGLLLRLLEAAQLSK